MADQPIFFKTNDTRTVNPIKILPSLLDKQKQDTQRKPTVSSNQMTLIGTQLHKSKGITKEELRKHYRTKMCPNGR
jgi:hypothetical protein